MKDKMWSSYDLVAAAGGAIFVGFAIVVVVSIGFWVIPDRVEWAHRLWDFVWKFVGIAIIGILYVGVTKLSETTIVNALAFLLLIAFSVLAAIYVINVMNFMDLVSFWMGESVVQGILRLILAGLGLVVFMGFPMIVFAFWASWRDWKTKIKVSGLYESDTRRRFRRITVPGPDGKDIVRVSVYETGQVVVARPGGSPTGLGERIIISPTFQVKRSTWHGNEDSGKWDTFELVEGGRTYMSWEDEN